MPLALTAQTTNFESQLNFEQIAGLLGDGTPGHVLTADADGNPAYAALPTGNGLWFSEVTASTHTLTNGELALCSAGVGTQTITLPAPFANEICGVYNYPFSTQTVVLAGGGNAIIGPTVGGVSMTLAMPGSFVVVQWYGGAWAIVAGGPPQIADTGWLSFPNGSMTNSWVNSVPAFGFRLQGNIVRLRGALTGGTSGSAALTLPAGFRPASNLTMSTVMTSVAVAAISLATTGILAPFFPAGSIVSLDGLSFPVD